MVIDFHVHGKITKTAAINNEVLVILAHPYRRSNEFPKLSLRVLDKIDALEFNATDLHKHGIDKMKNKVIELSKKLNKNIISGSDSHHLQFTP